MSEQQTYTAEQKLRIASQGKTEKPNFKHDPFEGLVGVFLGLSPKLTIRKC